MINVLLLCGGQSPEHEISLRSARNVAKALDLTIYQPYIIGITHSGRWLHLPSIPSGEYLSEDAGDEIMIVPGQPTLFETTTGLIFNPQVVFPVLHGPNGEDGGMQGLLQLLDLPYVGPNILGSAVAMDKDVAKSLLSQAGVRVAKGKMLTPFSKDTYESLARELGSTLFVKPANMGSSVGVHKVRNTEQFTAALKDAFVYDRKVIVEEMIVGRELECAVIGFDDYIRVTYPGEIRAEEEYSFDEKYSEASVTQLDIPAKNITSEQETELKRIAISAFRALNCEIMSRVDMFMTAEGVIYVNEINTLPGFTNISMYPKLWENEGLSYSALISELLELAIKRHGLMRGLKKTRL
jgi:D-alanine-D-alanine ligase